MEKEVRCPRCTARVTLTVEVWPKCVFGPGMGGKAQVTAEVSVNSVDHYCDDTLKPVPVGTLIGTEPGQRVEDILRANGLREWTDEEIEFYRRTGRLQSED